jgi:hypothetical protein
MLNTVLLTQLVLGPCRTTLRHCESGESGYRIQARILCVPILTLLQRMQTSAKGTYSGMLHCAGGILKNEGPLAFCKVMLLILYAVLSHILLGHVNTIAVVSVSQYNLEYSNMQSGYLQLRILLEVKVDKRERCSVEDSWSLLE